MEFKYFCLLGVYIYIYIFVYMFRIDWKTCKSHKAEIWHVGVFWGRLGQVQVLKENSHLWRKYDVIVTFLEFRKITYSITAQLIYMIEGWNFNKVCGPLIPNSWRKNFTKVPNSWCWYYFIIILAKIEKLLKLIAFFDIWVLQGISCMIKLE